MSRRAGRVAVVLVGVVVAALAACSGGSGGGSGGASSGGSASSGSDDPQGSWILAEGTVPTGDLTIPKGQPITLVVEGTKISGFAGCNSYSSEVATARGSWRVQPINSTMMACNPKADAFETAYLAGLRTVDQATVDGKTLTLDGRGTSLTYEAGETTG